MSWWRHQMETFSALLAICAGNWPVPGEFPIQRPVTRSFDVYFDLRPNKRLSKQLWDWWFETQSWSLWRHCSVIFKSMDAYDKTSGFGYMTQHWFPYNAATGARPTKEISIKFWIQLKIHLFISSLTSIWSQRHLTHSKMAQLSWNVQNFFGIGSFSFHIITKTNLIEFWIRLNYL